MGEAIPALIFVRPNNLDGLVILDPKMHLEPKFKVSSQTLWMPFEEVKDHGDKNAYCVIPLKAPENEGKGLLNPFLLYTMNLVDNKSFPLLASVLGGWDRESPANGDVGA